MDVYHDGRLVFGFEVTYVNESDQSKIFQVGHHIGNHLTGDVQCSTFDFNEGEYISQFNTMAGDLVDKVKFFTNQGRQFEAGGNGGALNMAQMSAVSNPRVVAVGGGLGGHMHHFRVYYVQNQ
ncbi:peptide n- [Stylonychia lemnae]|uniref:Peptide n n=1 Tax=Stylonychia lemnae TaxID=5949 RepID=A0A078AC55_STYLE|nr:peptide n- [Stylonychia lemnae]|eukprot:CDW79416.1 peptide n- [Stylonychia lemnae]